MDRGELPESAEEGVGLTFRTGMPVGDLKCSTALSSGIVSAVGIASFSVTFFFSGERIAGVDWCFIKEDEDFFPDFSGEGNVFSSEY